MKYFSLRAIALSGLIQIKDAAFVPYLIFSLQDPDSSVRLTAIAGLGQIPDFHAVQPLWEIAQASFTIEQNYSDPRMLFSQAAYGVLVEYVQGGMIDRLKRELAGGKELEQKQEVLEILSAIYERYRKAFGDMKQEENKVIFPAQIPQYPLPPKVEAPPHIQRPAYTTGGVAAQLIFSGPKAMHDHAGAWDCFGPGQGYGNNNPADWELTMILETREPKTVKAVELQHKLAGEGWSTSRSHLYGVQPYPLVIFYHGKQLNTAYDQELGTFPPGRHEFLFYAQRESPQFHGATARVFFSYGSVAEAETD